MTDNPTGQRAEKPELLGSLFRLVAGVGISYYVVVSGGFSHSTLIAITSAVGIISTMTSVVLALTRIGGLPLLAGRIGMVLAGGLLTTGLPLPGWIIFGVGVINLMAASELTLALAIPVVFVGGLPIVIEEIAERAGTEPILLTAVGVVGIGVAGYSRRLVRNRRRQDAELVERSRELEQRSTQLISQTERAQAETARAAALEERARIARDIHDLLAHSLGGLVVQLDAADALLSGGDTEQATERLRTSRRLAVEGLQEARAAVRELRAGGSAELSTGSGPDTDDGSPGDVAAEVLKIIRGPVGVQLGIEFDVVGSPVAVPAEVATAFAAVTREALTNINKHAPGQRVGASLIFDDDAVRLELINALPAEGEDDHRPLSGTGGGFGIAGMRQRLAEVGGTLSAGRQGERWLVSARWRAEADDPNPPAGSATEVA